MVTVPSICKSFQVVSFALWIVCRREIGRLSAWWVSGCFIGWGKFASWKGPLMRSREAMLSRHSVTLITFGIGCRNTCLRKERTSTRNHQLKTCWSPACQRNCSPTSPPVRLLPSLRRLNRRPPQKVRPREREKQWQQSKGQNSLHLLQDAYRMRPWREMPVSPWACSLTFLRIRGFHPSNCQQIPWSLCCAELSWIGALWFADSLGCFWIFSWKAFSFWFFSRWIQWSLCCAEPSWIGVLCFADPLCRFWIFTCLVCPRLISTFRQGLSGCMVFRLYLVVLPLSHSSVSDSFSRGKSILRISIMEAIHEFHCLQTRWSC